MENKDIILFILVICVIYLLYCNNNRESFGNDTTSSSNATTSAPNAVDVLDAHILSEVNRRFTELTNESITDSIKNLGLIAKEIQKEGDLTLPTNVNITGKLNLLPEGTVVMWTKSEIPNGWVKCDGQNVPGFGNTPDLRGRFVLGEGNGNNLTNRTLNQVDGAETHTLGLHEIPPHKHSLERPTGNVTYGHGTNGNAFWSSERKEWPMGSAGGGQAHNNMPPFWVLIYIMKVY